MPTLWDIVTGNSTLPVDPANSFWDHLNNQAGGGGGGLTIYGETVVELETVEYDVELQTEYEADLETEEYSVELEPEIEVEIE